MVVISLSSIPGREALLRKCVKSLLRQRRVRVRRIHVVIPQTFKRLGNTPYPAKDLKKLKKLNPQRIRILRPPVDLGPGLKYAGHGKSGVGVADDLTFVCDDDFVYHPLLIWRLRRILRERGADKRASTVVSNRKHAGGLCGFGGVLLPSRVLEGYQEFLATLPAPTLEVDDDTLTAFLKAKGVAIVKPRVATRNKPACRGLPAHALKKRKRRRKQNQALLKQHLRAHPIHPGSR